jgi:hypothetical protein
MDMLRLWVSDLKRSGSLIEEAGVTASTGLFFLRAQKTQAHAEAQRRRVRKCIFYLRASVPLREILLFYFGCVVGSDNVRTSAGSSHTNRSSVV